MRIDTFSIISIITFVCAVFSSLFSFINAPKCKHGVRNGRRFIRNSYKCAKCQDEHLASLADQEQQRIWQMKRAEIKTAYRVSVINAIKQRRESIISDLSAIHSLSPSSFEDLVANLYRKMGYQVHQTPYSNDGGKDAYVIKDGIVSLVECKRYSPSVRVGRPLLQKLFAAMNEEQISSGIFITTSSFSKEAVSYGKQYGIQTIDGNQLIEMLLVFSVHSKPIDEYHLSCPFCGEPVPFRYFSDCEFKLCPNGHSVNNIFYKNNSTPIVCFDCGKKMVRHSGRYGQFYGCIDYPKCRFTISCIEYHNCIDDYSSYQAPRILRKPPNENIVI